MLSNYFRLAFRNIRKDKVFSLINIIGLAVGITCFITLTLFIIDELYYDSFNKNSDQIYRIYVKSVVNGEQGSNSKTSGSLGPTLIQNFPEVLSYSRIGYFGPRVFRYKDKVTRDGSIYAVDSTFFDVFNLSFIEGNPETALNRPNTMVITETASKRLFGDENPFGKTVNTDNGDFLITGFIRDFPKNSHFRCLFLESITTYEVNQRWLDLWFSTYVVLKKGTDPSAFEKKMEKLIVENVGPEAEALLGVPIRQFLSRGNQYGFYLQPLNSIYLYSQREYDIDPNTEWGNIQTSDIAYTYIFSAVSVFILLIAVINFMNLSTARSERRAKEVGIRKTLGSNKLRLIWQFISESILMSFLSVLLALALVEFILPLYNQLIERELKLEFFNNFYTVPLLIAFILFVGILAGSYPAFYLSSFQPAHVLKTSAGKGNRKSIIRSALVIFQFAVSITLLIGTIIINNQLDYIQNKNLGFNKNHLVSINNANVLGSNLEAFKQELLKNPKVLSITNSSRMFQAGIPGHGYLFNKKSGTDPILFQFLDVDYDFLKTFQIKLQSGRFFSKEFSTDTLAVIVNEAALKNFNLKNLPAQEANPIGKELTELNPLKINNTYKIIGVIKDFNYESLHKNVRPLALHLSPVRQPANILTVKVFSGDLKKTINFIEETWKRLAGEEGMFYNFVDDNLKRLYEAEKKTSIIATIFSLLAIFIACLGLFGLAAFVTEQRTKEIGIRKALGASVLEIVVLLSTEFTKWVILANIISWPIAYYVMKNWLENFAFRIDINLWSFILSGLAALIIALLTVGMHAVKAAAANPVNSLKYE